MTRAEGQDPILEMLASLPSPASSDVRRDRVRARCHGVLARRRRQQELAARRRSRVMLVLDAAVLLVSGLYLASAVTEALRLVSLL